MPSISNCTPEGNDLHGEGPAFEDEPTEASSSGGNPVADAFHDVMDHFSEHDHIAPQNEVTTNATEAYLGALDVDDPPMPRLIERQLLAIVNKVVEVENRKLPKGTQAGRLVPLHGLTPWQIARILHRLYVIKEVVPGGMSLDKGVGVLAVYQPSGRHRGTYRPAEFSGQLKLEDLAQSYDASLNEGGFKEVTRLVRLYAERAPETLDCDLIPMDNAIHNYRTNERIEFSPEYVFLAKFHTALPERRPDLPVIVDERCEGGTWDVESWTEQMHPSEGMAEYIWKIRCAMLRNRVNWRKAFCPYDPLGSTGKGTENELIRSLIGPDNCVSVPLADFGKEFGKEPLLGALANIVDELAVGAYYRDLSDFKATITHDRITINRKHEKPLSYKPHVGSLFNLNEHVGASDKTNSLLRRFSLIPFKQRFIGAADNPSIKEDYVQRREVREYIAYKVLVEMPKFWDLTAQEPPLVKQTLEEYRLESQSVSAWADEFLGQFRGPFVAFGQAYAHYYAWAKERGPASKPLHQKDFTFELKQLLNPDEWIVPTVTGKDGRVTDKQLVTRTWITEPEPVLDEFHYVDAVAKWQPVHAAPYMETNGTWALPKAAPKLTRGFVRCAAWEAYQSRADSSQAVATAFVTSPAHDHEE